jgi:hypothetical protein
LDISRPTTPGIPSAGISNWSSGFPFAHHFHSESSGSTSSTPEQGVVSTTGPAAPAPPAPAPPAPAPPSGPQTLTADAVARTTPPLSLPNRHSQVESELNAPRLKESDKTVNNLNEMYKKAAAAKEEIDRVRRLYRLAPHGQTQLGQSHAQECSSFFRFPAGARLSRRRHCYRDGLALLVCYVQYHRHLIATGNPFRHKRIDLIQSGKPGR